MKYYVYLDSDDNPVIRLKDYLDTYDPGFWTRNANPSIVVWTVDSGDISSVRSLLERFQRQNTPTRIVRDVCQSIGFDLDEYMASLTAKKAKPKSPP